VSLFVLGGFGSRVVAVTDFWSIISHTDAESAS